MKPDFVEADNLLDCLAEEPFAVAALVGTSATSLELLSHLDKLDDLNVQLYVVLVNNDEAARTLQVSKIPQLRFFKNGNEVRSHVGTLELNELKAMILDVKDNG